MLQDTAYDLRLMLEWGEIVGVGQVGRLIMRRSMTSYGAVHDYAMQITRTLLLGKNHDPKIPPWHSAPSKPLNHINSSRASMLQGQTKTDRSEDKIAR